MTQIWPSLQVHGQMSSSCNCPIGINATKLEKKPIHFKSDVFAAAAVVNAKSPY